ncbi:MAG TPA: LytTR family transcriptional regulator DNA-binding domain-containing protein [Bacteroidales bacterium]|nr:LytTR family transcriptional regulator DNA-binding domain-containing protein [Bacteroidales bacterium]
MSTSNLPQSQLIRVTIENGSKPIKLEEILFIKAHDKHSIICFTDYETLETNHLLKWYEEKLPDNSFCRCHDSFIVSFHHVECVSGNSFLMQKSFTQKAQYVPISEKKREATHKSYDEFIRNNNFH